MSVRIMFHKVTADGEQMSIQFDMEKRHYDKLEAGQGLLDMIRPYLQLMDDRLKEMNERATAYNYLYSKLPGDAKIAINNTLELLHGQRKQSEVDQVLAKAQQDYNEYRAELERKEREVLAKQVIEEQEAEDRLNLIKQEVEKQRAVEGILKDFDFTQNYEDVVHPNDVENLKVPLKKDLE